MPQDALAGANERRTFLLATLSLLLVAIAALAVAAWRHGSSVRARHQADELRGQGRQAPAPDRPAAHDHRQPGRAHVLVNREQEVIFTNQATASAAKSSIASIVGGRLSSIFGHAAAILLGDLSEDVAPPARARAPGAAAHARRRRWRVSRSSLIPVERIGERRQLVLLVLSDVTELKVAEQQHADLLRELVGKLSDAVDLHDPYSAHHASRMAEVVRGGRPGARPAGGRAARPSASPPRSPTSARSCCPATCSRRRSR